MAEPSGIRLAQRDISPVVRATEVAARHSGSIATRQLLAVGFTRSRIGRFVAEGRLHPRYPGVFAWGRADLPVAGELAAGLLYAGPGAALAGLSMLWWRSLLNRRPDFIHIDAPGFASSRDDLRVRHPAPFEREWHRKLPVVAFPQALMLATRALEHDSLRLVLARAEFKGCMSLQGLERALGRGRTGSADVRAAMNAHLPQLARCENGLEREYVLLCERYGIEIPDPNVPIGRYRPDMLWRHRNLIVELDGWRAHHTAAQLGSDGRKQEALEARGFVVERFTRDEVFGEPSSVARRTRRALRR